MQIKRSRKYLSKLFSILEHISKDKITASRKFKNDLDKKIKDITNFPYKNRQSIYFDNENIRDMIFKGYTIVYEINSDEKIIEILDIFNKNKP
ncbi:type II toxin-antitoxin system RelE/ParE family toxin [Hydrogenimonas sp.]